jgi:hypothetical protein
LKNSPLESSCVVVALIENYSTLNPLKFPLKNHEVVTLLWQMSDIRESFLALSSGKRGEKKLVSWNYRTKRYLAVSSKQSM